MNAARSLIEEVRLHGVSIAVQGETLKLTGKRPLSQETLARLKTSKAAVIIELRADLSWWRDANAIHDWFEERAAIIEFDGGMPRGEAEVLARDCLAVALMENGLSEDEANETANGAGRP